MESSNWIESGIVWNLKNQEAVKKLPPTNYFVKQKATVDFILSFVDEYNNFPTDELLKEKFSELDDNAKNANLDYCLAILKKQAQYRAAVEIIVSQQNALKQDPTSAIKILINKLSDINLQYDEDIIVYGMNDEERLQEYQKRKEVRSKGLKIHGILTPFRTINKTGLGWLPGDLVSIFARPGVGKTWVCIKTAAIATLSGHKTLLISCEMPKTAIELRADVIYAKMYGYEFSHNDLKTGNTIDEEKYKEFLMKNTKNKSLLICDSINKSSISLSGIASLVRKYKPDFIVLDAIQLMSTSEKMNAVWERMQNLFYGIKGLCVTNNIATFVSTQANRNAANEFLPPKVSEIAFGDALFQSSDIAMALYRDKDDNHKRKIQFQKFRDSEMPSDFITLFWDVDHGDIKEE